MTEDRPEADGRLEVNGRLELRGRLVRPVAVLWGLAGTALLLGELVRLVDVGALGWQLPVGLLASALAWRLWCSGCVLDPHGFEACDVRGRRRVLWSTLDAVEVDLSTRVGVPVRVRRRDGTVVPLDGTWGMRARDREAVVERLRAWAAPHGVAVEVLTPS